MKTDFSEAVTRLPIDRPRQFVFTCEVILRENDVYHDCLGTALTDIRSIGAFEIVDVEVLDIDDPRRL